MCVINIRELVMKVLLSILLYYLHLIFMIGRVGLGELMWKNT